MNNYQLYEGRRICYEINYYQLVVQIFNHLEIIILLFEELLSIVLFPLKKCLLVS